MTVFNLVLHAPRIPQNTGQIARACHAMNCRLHLVRPLGFRVDAAALRRSAVGYLDQIDFTVHDDEDAFRHAAEAAGGQLWLLSSRGRRDYRAAPYRPGDWLVFGNETEGLPAAWLDAAPECSLAIPMLNPEVRCLNVSTAAAVVLFEAIGRIGAHEAKSLLDGLAASDQ